MEEKHIEPNFHVKECNDLVSEYKLNGNMKRSDDAI